MERQEWLASLKPGDDVIVSGTGPDSDRLLKVHRRTPSGRIIVSYGGMRTAEFNPDGFERGNNGWRRGMLIEPTKERRAAIEQRELSRRIERVNFRALDIDTLRAIAALLK